MSDQLHTFVFADLAGFTALTEAHGDERAADVALEFCSEINRLLPEDAEDLKMLGDACLLRVGDAAEAIALGLSLTGELGGRHGFPDVRVGMHTGTAARRGDDWFGSAVNIAARVSALAGPCEVLLTATTRDAADERGGVAPVRLYQAQRETAEADSARWVTDPVCQMRLDAEHASSSIVHDGAEVFFCSAVCAGEFVRAPERYVRGAQPR